MQASSHCLVHNDVVEESQSALREPLKCDARRIAVECRVVDGADSNMLAERNRFIQQCGVIRPEAAPNIVDRPPERFAVDWRITSKKMNAIQRGKCK